MRRRILISCLVMLTAVGTWQVSASVTDPICHAVTDPNQPSQLAFQCHQGLRGEIPNDPTQENPSAHIAVSPSTSVAVGQLVTFDGTGSYSRDGRPLHDWIWDFGDGAQAAGGASQAARVSHRYHAPGQYITMLYVHDDMGWRAHTHTLISVGQLAAETGIRESFTVPSRADGGVGLQGQLTRPSAPGRFPVLLEYGPYCPYEIGDSDARFALIRSGYIYATVSAPGLCGSSGSFDMFGRQTQTAGYDAVEWLAAQPWSNGKVALTGFSGPAVAAALTAGSRPPHLVAGVIMASYADQYRDIVYPGGIFNSNTFVNAWRTLLYEGQPGMPQNALGQPGQNWQQDEAAMLAHPYFDSFWKERAIVDYPTPKAPILYYGSDHDLWPRSLFELARWLRPAGGRVIQCVGAHGCSDTSGYEFSDDLPAAGEGRAWLDHFMKGVPNGVQNRPAILSDAYWGGQIAQYGFNAGTWTGLDAWPRSIKTWDRLYLDGTPALDAPPSGSGPFLSLSLAPPAGAPGSVPNAVAADPAQGASKGDDSALLTGSGFPEVQQVDDAHTLVYETPVLSQNLRVVGPIELHIQAALTSPDFAWSAQLEDVWPDGSSNWISEGYLLASQRALDPGLTLYGPHREIVRPYHDFTQQSQSSLVPGQIYSFDIEIWGVGNIFRTGHRLRLELAGQNAVWRQNATGGGALVFHDTAHPSYLLLPVVPVTSPLVKTIDGIHPYQ